MSTGLIDVHSHHYPDSYLEACRRPGSGLEHYVRDDGHRRPRPDSHQGSDGRSLSGGGNFRSC